MKIAAIQMVSGVGVVANLAAARKLLEEAAANGVELALLPEYFCLMGARDTDKLALAEDAGRGTIQDFLAQTAQRLGLWIVGGTIPLKVPGRSDRVYAASLVYDAAGRNVARYDKMHLFDVEVPGGERYRESASIEPGAQNLAVIDSPVGKLGLTVCYDLRFPELYRSMAQRGAEILLVPSAFTERTGRAHWDVLLRARAIENQCYVVAPNQCGEHPGGRRTWGHSSVVDPWGQVLAQREDGEGVVLAPVPLASLRKLRADFPVLNHRRLDSD